MVRVSQLFLQLVVASYPGGVVILLIASCWVTCDGLASDPGGVVILLVTSYWVPFAGLVSHPRGSSNTLSCFMLQRLSQASAIWAAYDPS